MFRAEENNFFILHIENFISKWEDYKLLMFGSVWQNNWNWSKFIHIWFYLSPQNRFTIKILSNVKNRKWILLL